MVSNLLRRTLYTDTNMTVSLGLHFLLHQATQGDIEMSSYISTVPLAKYTWNMQDSDTTKAIKRLPQDPSGASITAIADRVVKVHGSPTIRRINNALDSWRTTWDLHIHHDTIAKSVLLKETPYHFGGLRSCT
jgi:hypothetical protein